MNFFTDLFISNWRFATFNSVYSGSDEEFIVKDLTPGMQYLFR